jgi:hypothetical protein
VLGGYVIELAALLYGYDFVLPYLAPFETGGVDRAPSRREAAKPIAAVICPPRKKFFADFQGLHRQQIVTDDILDTSGN